jgi:hypothetical protein
MQENKKTFDKDFTMDIPQSMIEDLRSSVVDVIKKANKMEHDIFMEALRKNAIPPMKGRITPGKLKVRGIKRCYDPEKCASWLEQRGEIISDIFIFDYKELAGVGIEG